MKKITVTTLLVIITFAVQAQKDITKWLHAGPFPVYLPALSETGKIDNSEYTLGDALTDMNPINSPLKQGTTLTFRNNSLPIKTFMVPADSLLAKASANPQMHLLTTHINADQWMQPTFTLHCNGLFEMYLDGEKIHTQSTCGTKTEKTLTLSQGSHELTLRLVQPANEKSLQFWATLKPQEDLSDAMQINLLAPRKTMNIHNILNGNSISQFALSPSGKYYYLKEKSTYPNKGKSTQRLMIKLYKDHSTLFQLRDAAIAQLQWLPKSDKISYTIEVDGKTNFYVMDMETRSEKLLAEQLSNFGSYYWSPNEQFVVFSVYKKADKPGNLKRIYGNEDRLPYFRNRSYLHLLDLASGQTIPLISGHLSAQLNDIHPSGKKLLFSTSRAYYQEIPFSKQSMYEMNLEDFSLDTLWKDKQYSGYASYSPSGKMLLVQGGPQCFGNTGENVAAGTTPNNYDSQLYRYNPATQKAEALTKDFAPSVNQAFWIEDDKLFVSVAEKDERNLYQYNFKEKHFSRLPLQVEVLNSIDFNREGTKAIYSGTSITSPNKVFAMDVRKAHSTLIAFPEEKEMQGMQFGSTEACNFTNKRGDEIAGRVYYPPNYDKNKKYPVIVYYYGGTSPVERSFGGRYPKNVWAAKGYMVYVLQPSGTIGFGQKFSALHVNGWGKEAIDDIIEGTQHFLDTHPTADAENMGCIGASYGGFTTMLLQTRTDLFKTAISHAGISSIASYWGEGYWGYTYSAVASANAFPWNRKDVYIENSPLFNADKFNNSILLLHGTADTNVPVGESLQYYAALKILGKDVEMVLVDGEDHWIIDYQKRIQWHNTIISWFDYKLKGQAQQWEHLYPEKNLN